MKLLLVLSTIITMIFKVSESACPAIQKLEGTPSSSCALSNTGLFRQIECDQDITSFTLTGWLRLTGNDSIIAHTGKSDVYFALISSLDNYKRFVLRYTFNNPIGKLTSSSPEPRVWR